MKKKNGFTLIELLAVIVILAIIALIATPIVLNLIEAAKKGAAKDSAYGVRKEAQLIYSTALIEQPTSFNKIVVDFSKEVTVNGKTYPEAKYYENTSVTDENAKTDVVLFEMDGTKPTTGTITILGNGKIMYDNIKINGYNCTIPESGEVSCVRNSTNNSGTTPSVPTIETCPGCVFAAYSGNKYLKGTTTKQNGNEQLPVTEQDLIVTDYVQDYTTLKLADGVTQRPHFLGLILDDNHQIEHAYLCFIRNNSPYCLEGHTDETTYQANSTYLKNLWNNTCVGDNTATVCRDTSYEIIAAYNQVLEAQALNNSGVGLCYVAVNRAVGCS